MARITGPKSEHQRSKRYEGYKVGRITPDGAFTEFPLRPDDFPFDMIVGPDHNVWFTGNYLMSNYIGRITPDGTVTEFELPKGSQASGLTVGPDGHIWFADAGANKLGYLDL